MCHRWYSCSTTCCWSYLLNILHIIFCFTCLNSLIENNKLQTFYKWKILSREIHIYSVRSRKKNGIQWAQSKLWRKCLVFMDTTYEDSQLFTLLFGLHLLCGKQTNEQTKRQTLSPSITALKRQKQVAVCEFVWVWHHCGLRNNSQAT